MDEIQKIREQFPVTKKKAYLNHAAHSPLPQPVVRSIYRYVDQLCKFGIASIECTDWGKPCFANLVGARNEEIAVVGNTSEGMNIAANMLNYPRGAKVVTTDLEFPSAVFPWLRKRLGVKVQYVKSIDGKVSLDDMEKAVDDKTVAVTVSHVEYANGFRHNLRVLGEIVHEHGAYLVVDAIQSVGTMPIDVHRDDVDFLAAACYKWLLSPPGVAYLYVRDDLIETLEPPFTGWASVKPEIFDTPDYYDIRNLDLSKTASRFEAGSASEVSCVGAYEGMKMLLSYGTENVKKRIFKITDHLIDSIKELGLELQTPEDKQCRSGIVNFKVDKPQQLSEKLQKKGIVVCARANGIRVSPHYYNTEKDIDKLVEEVKRLHGKKS